MPQIVKQSLPNASIPDNMSDFSVRYLFPPFNTEIFTDADFMPSCGTDFPEPEFGNETEETHLVDESEEPSVNVILLQLNTTRTTCKCHLAAIEHQTS